MVKQGYNFEGTTTGQALKDGYLVLKFEKNDGALPTASALYRGQVWATHGAAGAADVYSICCKKADNSYAWVTWATG